MAYDKELTDILDIVIDKSLKKEDRIRKFIKEAGNPYNFKVGDIEVAISFEPDGERLQEKMERYFESMII